jgi:hypothetical protein
MTTYDELPIELKEYIDFIEKEEKSQSNVSVGPDRTQTILRLTNALKFQSVFSLFYLLNLIKLDQIDN